MLNVECRRGSAHVRIPAGIDNFGCPGRTNECPPIVVESGWNREFPKVQILTIEDLLAGKKPDVPPMRATFQRAERLRSGSRHGQKGLFEGKV